MVGDGFDKDRVTAEGFGDAIRGNGPDHSFIIQIDGKDAGYIQCYVIDHHAEYAWQMQVDPGAVGIDLFIGDQAARHRGHGALIITEFLEQIVFGKMHAAVAIIAPEPGNVRAIRAYEKAGFVWQKTVPIVDEESPANTGDEYVMRLTREEFDRQDPRVMTSSSMSPEQHIRAVLEDRSDVSIATAESCTGGTIASRLTSVPGSSMYMKGGIIAYANDVKERLLGVPRHVLENPGAVSEECAHAMAEGARARLDVTHAVSATGIAGPDGGTERKPVGLVYIALSTEDHTKVEKHIFEGDRQAVIAAASDRALALLLESIS